ncbi:MAG: OsmC family protein [Pseudomonadales bacterium]|jgi:putative redox protein|nr:OsmC family protein [Pseudomonadales bacterium]MDP7359447.1 OsmC family protein [Pseudomonadales bacterium]MDP7595882.1 OsmC family protein [Pseudomonadales bacterium]HJN52509.1 OsmC family protein [Pseudomonadales bacterium]|tara:strand:+ start:189 stop:608 length:420 start_codon:yes stop_codon:yes gene_type:complete
MNATITWVDDAMFLGVSGSGHSVVLDGPAEQGGRNQGMRPMEMLLLGMGGCTSFDVVSILKKGRQRIQDCRVEVTAERSGDIPNVFTKIHVHFIVKGKELKRTQVQRAIELSVQKYCSASIMLERGGVEISHDYEVQSI